MGYLSYTASILGALITTYALFAFCVVAYTFLKQKTLNPLKAIHIVSIVEVYAFTLFLIGILLLFKITGLLLFKAILFIMIVIFSGITATRLIAKTAYFYNLRFKKEEGN